MNKKERETKANNTLQKHGDVLVKRNGPKSTYDILMDTEEPITLKEKLTLEEVELFTKEIEEEDGLDKG